MKKFKTIHNELEEHFLCQRPITEHVKVRPKQCPSLKSIIEMAQRGTAPTNVQFAKVANDGFVPPHYSREDFTSLHHRYKELSREHSEVVEAKKKKSQEVTPPTPPQVTPPTPGE